MKQLWAILDRMILTAARRIRDDTVAISVQDFNLPIRLGGCGLTALWYTFTAAYKAVSKASRAALTARTNNDNDREALASITKQPTYTKLIHGHLQKTLVKTLTPTETKLLFDNFSYLGSRLTALCL